MYILYTTHMHVEFNIKINFKWVVYLLLITNKYWKLDERSAVAQRLPHKMLAHYIIIHASTFKYSYEIDNYINSFFQKITLITRNYVKIKNNKLSFFWKYIKS